MKFCQIKDKLDALQKDGPVSGSELKRRGDEEGCNSNPLKSLPGLDNVELEIERAFEFLHYETLTTYKNKVTQERSNVHINLIKQDNKPSEISDPKIDIPREDPTNTFSSCLEKYHSALNKTGSKAIDAQESLTRFKKDNGLDREAECPGNQIIFLIIGGILFLIVIFTYYLLASQESDSSSVRVLGTVLLINSILGFISAELLRAFNHYKEALRTTSRIVFYAFIVSAIIFNLGIGHYRDALDPNYPPKPLETDITEIPETQNESPQTLSETTNSADTWRSPSQEAINLLFSKFIFFNGIFSYVLAFLGIILFSIIGYFVWIHDDGYLLYGLKTRRYNQHINKWNTVRQEIVFELQTEHDRMGKDLQESRINFVQEYDSILANYDDFWATASNLIRNIRRACVNSNLIYRTANRIARQRLTPPPPHWDKPWEPVSWQNLTQESIDFLCSQEDAHVLTQQRNLIIDEKIEKLNEIYQDFLDKVSNFGPDKNI